MYGAKVYTKLKFEVYCRMFYCIVVHYLMLRVSVYKLETQSKINKYSKIILTHYLKFKTH